MTDDEELSKKINRAVFPGMQGGPLMHVILAKAVAFGEAQKPEFKAYCRQVIANARALAGALMERGYRMTSGGTDNHLMLVDLRPKDAELTGADAELWLQRAGIVCNKNGIPQDPRPPKFTSGVRLGTPAVTTRGFVEPDMRVIAGWIDRLLSARGNDAVLAEIRGEVQRMCAQFPMPA